MCAGRVSYLALDASSFCPSYVVRVEMEVVVAASERSSTIMSKLTSVLHELYVKTDMMEKEVELVEMEQCCKRTLTKTVNAEVVVTEAPVRTGGATKVAKAAVESMMRSRVSAASHASLGEGVIIVSQFEYKYITGHPALVASACNVREDGSSGTDGVTSVGYLSGCELAVCGAAMKWVTREAGTTEEAERAGEEWRARRGQELYDINATVERMCC
jgi:hypothetical protein